MSGGRRVPGGRKAAPAERRNVWRHPQSVRRELVRIHPGPWLDLVEGWGGVRQGAAAAVAGEPVEPLGD